MKYGSAEEFVIRQLELLNIERDAEIAEGRKLQESTTAKILQEKGICLTNLALLNIRAGLYGRTIATFGSKIMGKELPSTNLGSGKLLLLFLFFFWFKLFIVWCNFLFLGDIVGIFPNAGMSMFEKDQICSGIVSSTKTATIDVALDLDTENVELNENDSYKILKLANNVTYRRLKE